MRDTLFISHATPEDNNFTIWLASRLELLGYKVWFDKEGLLGGETFWNTIESVINITTIKFLLVYSKNILVNGGIIKNGIKKEIEFVNKLLSENPQFKDFLIILNIDNSPFDFFPGAADLNQIQFSENWAVGLNTLQKKLKRDEVILSNTGDLNQSSNWFLNNYIIKNPIIEKKELYYTNWWSVDDLPLNFYIIKYENETHARKVASLNDKILLVRDANCVTTFKKDLISDLEDNFGTIQIKPVEIFEIKLSDLIQGYERELFPTFRDAENHFKKLLKRSLHNYFKSKGLFWYELANKNIAYYHTFKSLPTSKVSFSYPYRENTFRKKKKQLFGKHLDIGKWHFAISLKPALTPFIGFHLKNHLIFSKNGYQAIENKDTQHLLRRKKGRRMFNEDWRDLLLAFIASVKNSDESISLITNVERNITLKPNLEMFWSDFGYHDPSNLERQELFIEGGELIEEIEH